MTITQLLPICDICDKYILLEMMHNFSVQGIDQTLQCHDKCKPVVLDAMEKKDWKLLPEGPLRRCFEKNYIAGDSESGEAHNLTNGGSTPAPATKENEK